MAKLPDLECTLGQVLHRCANLYADRPFLTIAETCKTLSYNQLEILTNRLAHGLRHRFAHDLNYAAIYLENSVEYLAASYALKKIDCVEVSINRAMVGAPLVRMVDQTKAPILFTSGAHLNVIGFEQLLSDDSSHLKSNAKPTDVAAILFTSGTTGVSKGCLLSHRYAVRTAQNMVAPFRVTDQDCVYTPYPLSHIGPSYYDVLTAMITGGRVVLRQKFSASRFWQEVKEHNVTWFMMLGSVQQLLWAQPKSDDEKNHQVTRCWGTPAPVPKADFDARYNLHLIPGGGYGSTDAGWVVVPQWDHPGGLVLPHFEIAIHDSEDNALPADTPGELVLRPREPGVMSDGYFDMPERTLHSRRNLWFHTGDIGKLDAQGRFYFLHRMSERIRVRGEMVSAYEVEEVILSHPDIHDCAVIGVPSEYQEEDVKAYVVLKPERTLTAVSLIEFCQQRLAKFMVPRQVRFLAHMPLTPTGKPEKGKLAKMHADNDRLEETFKHY